MLVYYSAKFGCYMASRGGDIDICKVRKMFQKTNISYPLIKELNSIFSEDFTYALNG